MLPRRFMTKTTIRRRWYTPLGSNFSDNDPVVLDREKNKLLKGKVKSLLKSAPGWNEMLASDSEAVVKAEREPDPSSLKELQNESIESILNNDIEVIEQIEQEVKIKTKEKVIAKHESKTSN